MCTAHMLMRFSHLINRSFVCKAKEGRHIRLLYLMNINKDILAFYWLRFAMWFYFIFHGMTTKSSKEVIIYHVILNWPVKN